MSKTLLTIVALVAAGCGGSSRPCTTCPTVSGTYSVSSPAVSDDASSCMTVYYSGYTGPLTVTQNGSAITLATDWFEAPGTLFDDNSLGCPSTKNQTSWGVFGDLHINGGFAGTEGARSITLNLSFSATTPEGDLCRLSAHMNGTQTSP